jgi:hypothetical protein
MSIAIIHKKQELEETMSKSYYEIGGPLRFNFKITGINQISKMAGMA